MTQETRTQRLMLELKKVMMGGYPLIFVETNEEEYFYRQLRAKLPMFTDGKERFYQWDPVTGLRKHEELLPGTSGILQLFEFIGTEEGGGIFYIKDLKSQLLSEPLAVRSLVQLYYQIQGKQKFVFFPAGVWQIPEVLQQFSYLLEFGLPDEEELLTLFNRHLANLKTKDWIEISLRGEDIRHVVTALKGMTLTESDHLIKKICYARKILDRSILKEFFYEKRLHTRSSGCLEFVEPTSTINDIGGLENLKDWLINRRELFSEEAQNKGLSPPKGLLVMGISGCGKSLCIKGISELWGLPLFRLDMGRVFGGGHGRPEAAFSNALKIMENIAPAILWLDEMEMGINTSSNEDISSRIFAGFLTWMQEKKASVFVAATANRIDLLPAEIIRKGRFDQVFFVDLPNEKERQNIFTVHLKKRGLDPDQFPIENLSFSTENWNGAEIESVIESAQVACFVSKREMVPEDLWSLVTSTVPLATTMSEQIKYIKDWASDRAVSATKKEVDTNQMVKNMTMG